MTYFKNSLFYIILYLLPKNFISRLIGSLASMRLPQGMARLVNNSFVKVFKLNMSEAELPLDSYQSLQALFTRRLKPGVRIFDEQKNAILSPCDGYVSEEGEIFEGKLLQAKNKYYELSDLLGSETLAAQFSSGYYITIYLSPRDYHRFHVPLDGKIIETIYIPGSLWPVNNWAVANIKRLFCQNERIISILKPSHSSKKLAHIAVGATNVGKINLAYCELSTNLGKASAHIKQDIKVERGEDLGEFKFGSTIILLFERGLINQTLLKAPVQVKVGQAIALMKEKASSHPL